MERPASRSGCAEAGRLNYGLSRACSPLPKHSSSGHRRGHERAGGCVRAAHRRGEARGHELDRWHQQGEIQRQRRWRRRQRRKANSPMPCVRLFLAFLKGTSLRMVQSSATKVHTMAWRQAEENPARMIDICSVSPISQLETLAQLADVASTDWIGLMHADEWGCCPMKLRTRGDAWTVLRPIDLHSCVERALPSSRPGSATETLPVH